MGMYNEVFKSCPYCDGRGYMQISQVIYGFGGFDLDAPETMVELNEEELFLLKKYIEEEQFFTCEKCNQIFYYNEKAKDSKLEFIKNLFK